VWLALKNSILIDFFCITTYNITFLEYNENICQGGDM
jgi:hypothetical protein